MRAHRRRPVAPLVALLVLASGCEAVDQARSRLAMPDSVGIVSTGSGLALGLQAPGVLRSGEEGTLRLSLANRSDTVVSRVRLELIVPGWAEPMPPRPGDREVSMAAMEDGATRFAYRMDETPLEPGQTQTVDQRIRVPISGLQADGATPWMQTVRARLVGPDGQPLAEVESEIALDSIASSAAPLAGPAPDPANRRDRLGPVQLGMTTTALRQAAPSVRDTSWSQEGMQQQGLLVPLAGNGIALAVLSGDSVARIQVNDSTARTAERLGVGSRLEELRAAYGSACADVAEGTLVVWFANAPGISFALDTPIGQSATQLRQNPASIPGSARVTRWWLRRAVDSCPR